MTGHTLWDDIRRARDPQWPWMLQALHQIRAAMDRGDQVLSVAVSFEDADFNRVLYMLAPDDGGEVRRYICPDPDAVNGAFSEMYVDITPETSPDLAEGDHL